jgi:hypothetical protein
VKYSTLLPCRKKEEGRMKTGTTIGFIKKAGKEQEKGREEIKGRKEFRKGIYSITDESDKRIIILHRQTLHRHKEPKSADGIASPSGKMPRENHEIFHYHFSFSNTL